MQMLIRTVATMEQGGRTSAASPRAGATSGHGESPPQRVRFSAIEGVRHFHRDDAAGQLGPEELRKSR